MKIYRFVIAVIILITPSSAVFSYDGPESGMYFIGGYGAGGRWGGAGGGGGVVITLPMVIPEVIDKVSMLHVVEKSSLYEQATRAIQSVLDSLGVNGLVEPNRKSVTYWCSELLTREYPLEELVEPVANKLVKSRNDPYSHYITNFSSWLREIMDPQLFIQAKGDIIYIRFDGFSWSIAQRIKVRVDSLMMTRSYKMIFFDLSINPGGYAKAAVDLAKLFLSKGDTAAVVEYWTSDVLKYKISDSAAHYNIPVAIRVSPRTGSASEIFTLALLGNLRDKLLILGTGTTEGKNYIGDFYSFERGAIYIMTGKWRGPGELTIKPGKGITPHIMLDLGDDGVQLARQHFRLSDGN